MPPDTMNVAPGQRLGPYEIVSPVGAGAMGEVYRARDTRLGRDVAVKVLPKTLATSHERLRRFEQEARAAAALNHPNILAVYDIGSTDGAPYLVSELLDGQTIRAALANGPLPLSVAIAYAMQIAQGLAAAHAKGIVHRDVKPENLFVTAERIKILDFGLAKLTEPASDTAADDGAVAATRTAGTTPGMVVGTVGYMSPEQVRGQAVDHRSDIFSLGCVLYEMVSGRRAFSGDTPADTMSAILAHEPPELHPEDRESIAPSLQRLMRRCLAKSPSHRFQSAQDLAFALEELLARPRPSAAAAPLQRAYPVRRRGWTGLAAAGVLGAIVGGLMAWRIAPAGSERTASFPVIQDVARLTHDTGFSEWPTWGPDGQLFAFASNRSGSFEIYVRRVEGGQGVNITDHPADDVQPALSPDGTSIAFVSTRSSVTPLIKIGTFIGFDTRTYGGDIWLTPTFGGQARRIAENGNFPAWHPSGRTVAYVTGQENHRTIAEIGIGSGTPRILLAGDRSSWEIVRLAYSPDARWMTFETSDRELFIMPTDGGQPRLLLRGTSHVWDASGTRIYYVNHPRYGGTRIEMAAVHLGAEGPRVDRTALVGVSTAALKYLALTNAGGHLLATGVEESLNLTRAPLSADGSALNGPEQELNSGQVRDRYPTVSFDSQRIAFSSNRLGQEELWLLDLPSRRLDRVEMPVRGGWITQACWARDSRHLGVVQFREDGASVHSLVAVDGSSTEQLRGPDAANSGNFACAFAPHGNRFVYSRVVDGFSQLFEFDVASRQDRQLTTTSSDKYEATWSPDGRWVAFTANTGGGVHVWRIPAAGGTEQQLTSGNERMRHAFYSTDGRWLYVQPSHRNIHRMPADGGPLQKVTTFDEGALFLEEPTISPDGRWLIYNRGRGGASLWMLTLGTP